MNIFDAHISGSLSVSASAEISNNLLVSGNLTVLGTVSGSISGSITNADSASFAPKYTLTSSFHTFTSSYNTGSFTGSFIGNGIGLYDIPASGITGLNLSRIAQGASTASISSTDGLRVNTNTEITGGLIVTAQISGSFKGDGTNLYNIPASGVTGLNLTRIADGSTTASISSTNGLRVNTNTEITGALTISGSITLNGVPVGTGKLDELTFNTYTSSNDSTNSIQNSRLTSIESTTSSLNIFSSSIDTTIKNKLNTETVISGSVQVLLTGTTGYSTFSSSVSTSIGFISSSVAITTSGLSSSIGSLSSSVATTTNTLSSSISSSIGSISSSIGSLSSSLATTTSGLSSSIESLSSSIATTTSGITSTVTSLSSSVSTTTSELSSSIGSLSSSLATTTLGTKNRVDSIESKTGSYATTGSNIFQGSQTITGSLYVSQDLIVAGSSSIQHISSSIVNISDNIITVNALNPSVRFGGLAVIDSGSSPQVSGSLLFDSVNNQWLFVHQNQASITSSVLLMGPETYNNLGNESYITQNKLVKSTGIEHLSDSNITDTGTLVSINSNSEVTGTLKVTGNITNPNISAIETSTGSLNTFTSSINTTIKSKLNADGVISGSVQVNHNTTTNYVANQHIDHTTVSITAGSGLTGGGDISSTRTINVGAGNGITVNADDIAIDTASATFTTGVKSKLNSDGVISGSAQVLNGTTIHSGSFFNGITVVSGSAQIDLTATTNYSTGIKTRLNTEGVVSGSSQITLSSTTGFGTYLNQALLTTSTPTFSTVSATTFTGALSGNATTATTAGALTSMNISQFTNNSGYITGINSSAVTTALGYTPYNATNPSGYISSYTETSTLQNVISRGATTNTGFVIENSNSTYSTPASTNVPVIYMHNTSSNENAHAVLALRTLGPTGGDPFVSFDINGVLGWTVGIDNSDADKFKIGKSWATVGTNTYFTIDTSGNSVFAGTISATNFSGTSSGTNTGDQTIPTNNNQLINGAGYITSYTETDTLATVTGRGASTSTAISINNTLTVTSGRIIARTGGANTYGIFSGYDNNNHMMSFRAAIAGSTSSPTITAGHQTTFIEYAEANDTTGWFFKSASTGTYEEIAKITRIGITPGSNGTQNLGSSSLRWNTVFTSDLSLSNGIGDYTIVEGENDLFLYNNKQNKVYKFMLQEVNPNDATPKRPE